MKFESRTSNPFLIFYQLFIRREMDLLIFGTSIIKNVEAVYFKTIKPIFVSKYGLILKTFQNNLSFKYFDQKYMFGAILLIIWLVVCTREPNNGVGTRSV